MRPPRSAAYRRRTPAMFMIGQPMDASGIGTLASHFPDRTVVI